MRFVGLMLVVLLTGHALPASASRWTDAEIRALPDYCQARLGTKGEAQFNSWRKTLGPDFEHTHHYCYGLIQLNRYYGARSSQEKKQILQGAYSNLVYVVQRVDPSYRILPEVYMNLGMVLSLQNKDGEALQAMLKAIELDPKLARAYSAIANQYVKLNKKDKALELTMEGLRQVPGNASLQRLYVKLGGQLPYPEPAAPQEQKPVEATTEAGEAETGTRTAQGAEPVAQTSNANDNKANEESRGSEAEGAVPPKIGSPSNPWCRFCPPEPGQ